MVVDGQVGQALLAAMLDLLADDSRLTEFAFVFSNPHFGFLFSKLAP